MGLKIRSELLSSCWITFLSLALLASGHAQVLIWTNTVGGLWDDPNNWMPGPLRQNWCTRIAASWRSPVTVVF